MSTVCLIESIDLVIFQFMLYYLQGLSSISRSISYQCKLLKIYKMQKILRSIKAGNIYVLVGQPNRSMVIS